MSNKPSEPKAGTRAHRTMLISIVVGRYYDALDLLKYAGKDIDPTSSLQRERAARYEADMRAIVQDFERMYGKPRRNDGFPLHIWQACHQPLNVRQFDLAWQAALMKAA